MNGVQGKTPAGAWTVPKITYNRIEARSEYMRLSRVRNTVILIVVVGAAMLLLRLLLAQFADFITYIYVAFVFVVVLYRLFTYLPRRAISFITRAAVVGILLGLALMIQPFKNLAGLFRPGFYLLLLSTVTYSVISYVRLPSSVALHPEMLEEMPVSISAAESALPSSGGNQ
jgi:hypothetical protein